MRIHPAVIAQAAATCAALPEHFEQASKQLTEDDVADTIPCGPDPEKHVEAIRDAGFDHVYVHQIGPDQKGFIRFYEREVMPRVRAVVERGPEPVRR